MGCNHRKRLELWKVFYAPRKEKKRFHSVIELHLELFLKKYKKPNYDSLVSKLRKLDSVTLPSRSGRLLKKLERSSYFARFWSYCLNDDPQDQDVS